MMMVGIEGSELGIVRTSSSSCKQRLGWKGFQGSEKERVRDLISAAFDLVAES